MGLKLGIPDHVLQSIRRNFTDPDECLYEVILEFLKQEEPRPTWRAIIDALKDASVNYTHLACELERRHLDPCE